MNSEQMKHLKERIAAVENKETSTLKKWDRWYHNDKPIPGEPDHVTKAREVIALNEKIIERWIDSEKDKERGNLVQLDQDIKETLEKVIFKGDAAEALKAVKELEKKYASVKEVD